MILSAKQIDPKTLPRPQTTVAKNGLGFQRKFTRQFAQSAPEGFVAVPEPWFEYVDNRSPQPLICCPDLIARDLDFGFWLVIEVKQTWTPLALQKLRDVYCPVVAKAFGKPAKPLVVCRRLTTDSPRPQPTVTFALVADNPLIHWTGQGPILW